MSPSRPVTAVAGEGADALKLRTFLRICRQPFGRKSGPAEDHEQVMDEVEGFRLRSNPGGAARLRTKVGIFYDQLKSRP